MKPRYGVPFADGVYADPGKEETWLMNPMGFENILGHAGSTMAMSINGKPYATYPYDKPKIIGQQLAGNYHVYNEANTDPKTVRDVVVTTWDTNGSIIGGWSIKTCASLNIQYEDEKIYDSYGNHIKTVRHYKDGYDDETKISGVDLLHPELRFLGPADPPLETGSINSEWQRWKR